MKWISTLFLLFIMLFINSCVQKSSVPMTQEKVHEVKIAMILPYKTIGRYAYTTSTALFAYLLTRERPYTLNIFKINDESPKSIKAVLKQIREQGYHYVIAPVTRKGAQAIIDQEETIQLFFPTVHRRELHDISDNIYCGAIDYQAQIQKLMPLATSPLVVMYDKSKKGLELLEMTQSDYDALHPQNAQHVMSYAIDKKRSNLKGYLNKNSRIQNASFFLNTPLIKSAMILSQLSRYDVNVTKVLSTQINYDPLLLTMTQKQDRKHLFIANSITIYDDSIVQANALLNNDIVYDWINYASTVGVDYFYHAITGEPRIYDLPIQEHQVIYPIEIVQPTLTHFSRYRQ